MFFLLPHKCCFLGHVESGVRKVSKVKDGNTQCGCTLSSSLNPMLIPAKTLEKAFPSCPPNPMFSSCSLQA